MYRLKKINLPYLLLLLVSSSNLLLDFGESTNISEEPWILPQKDKNGHRLIVQGYFTERQISIDLRNEHKEPKEWLYTVPEFKIIRWVYNKEEWQGLIPKIISK